MQENNLAVTPEVTPPVLAEQPKQSNFLTILLSVLLVVSISIAGFFAYQTQRLVKELRVMSGELEQKTEMISEPTAESVATEGSEIDQTASWKMYNNSLFQFSFRYPKEFDLVDNLQKSIDPLAWTTRSTLDLKNASNNCSVMIMVNPDGFGPFFPNKMISFSYLDGKGLFITKETPNSENLTPNIYSLIGSGSVDNKIVTGVFVSASCPDSLNNQKYLDDHLNQILSTFKFLN